LNFGAFLHNHDRLVSMLNRHFPLLDIRMSPITDVKANDHSCLL
jgi:hypothetical protein